MKALTELESRSVGVMAMPSKTHIRQSRGLGTGLSAVVPVKDFGRAKERLAAVLSPLDRTRLAEAMLRDVLSVLAAMSELAGIMVVTGDAAAARVAEEFHAEIIGDVTGSGTNGAAARGLQVLAARGQYGGIVVPGDIPLVSADELREILAQARLSPIVLVAATRDGGTNLLLTQPPDLLQPCFGPDSFAKHVAAARAIGVEPRVLRLEGVGLDIDSPEDIAALIARSPSTRTHTSALLRQVTVSAEAGHGETSHAISNSSHEWLTR